MRPTPIPDDEIWDGAQRRVIAGPEGDLTGDIRPVEALVEISPSLGVPVLSVRCQLEAGDLEQLQAGAPVWISFYGRMVPFEVNGAEPEGK
jgi:hypothetical protein